MPLKNLVVVKTKKTGIPNLNGVSEILGTWPKNPSSREQNSSADMPWRWNSKMNGPVCGSNLASRYGASTESLKIWASRNRAFG